MNTNRLITISALISFAAIAGASLSGRADTETGRTNTGNLPSSREWIGLSIAFLMLSAAADLGLESAGGMAVLVMVTVLLVRGESAAAYLGLRLNASSRMTPLVNPTPRRIRNTRKALGMDKKKKKPTKPTKPGVITT